MKKQLKISTIILVATVALTGLVSAQTESLSNGPEGSSIMEAQKLMSEARQLQKAHLENIKVLNKDLQGKIDKAREDIQNERKGIQKQLEDTLKKLKTEQDQATSTQQRNAIKDKIKSAQQNAKENLDSIQKKFIQQQKALKEESKTKEEELHTIFNSVIKEKLTETLDHILLSNKRLSRIINEAEIRILTAKKSGKNVAQTDTTLRKARVHEGAAAIHVSIRSRPIKKIPSNGKPADKLVDIAIKAVQESITSTEKFNVSVHNLMLEVNKLQPSDSN